MATLQSLDRGLRALSLVSLAPEGLTVAEIATRLGTDRATAYRIVDTLEQHALVTRGVGKRIRLGAGAVVFAGRFEPQLVRAAGPVLQELADAAGVAAFLSLAQGDDACVPVLSAEPARQTIFQVSYRSRSPAGQGGQRHRHPRAPAGGGGRLGGRAAGAGGRVQRHRRRASAGSRRGGRGLRGAAPARRIRRHGRHGGGRRRPSRRAGA